MSGISSMTGAAALAAPLRGGEGQAVQAQWELRSVNGRGLDLRLRLPEGMGELEAGLRQLLSARIRRGSLSLNLRLPRSETQAVFRLDPAGLEAALAALAQVHDAAEARGIALRPATAADVLSIRGVMAAPQLEPEAEAATPLPELLAQAAELVTRFEASRAAEGEALAGVLEAQITQVAALLEAARALLPERRARQGEALRAALMRIEGISAAAEPGRLEQELALLATKSDIAEELDRLEVHIGAARALLAEGGPVGRQLDFLVQEFNREANTLCSKSGHAGLTRIGLDLKTVIDQMREQVQNIE